MLDSLGTWLEEHSLRVLPKSPIGQAIGYARSNWEALGRYLEAGFLAIDNNAAERALRPVAVGRNYAGPKIMRSRCRGCHVPPVKAPGSTPHNPITGRRGTRAASPSGGM